VDGETQHPNEEVRADSVADEADVPETSTPDAPEQEKQEPNDDQPGASSLEEELSLQTQLEQANARAEDYLDSLQRERASFQNYKKRVERERLEHSQQVAADVLTKFLPVLDDFYRAMEAIPPEERDQWFEGVSLILRKLERTLADQGVTEIEALGQPFDPNFHEAVGVDADADAESGIITEVMQRGYQLGDRVLRPAMVRVAG